MFGSYGGGTPGGGGGIAVAVVECVVPEFSVAEDVADVDGVGSVGGGGGGGLAVCPKQN